MDSKKLHKKLLKYGTLVAAVAGITEADAGIIYTDEVPDFAGAIGSQYFLDLNNDGTDDFRIWHNGYSNLYVSPLAATNLVLGSGGATYAYPFALTAGSPINAGAGTFYNNGFSGGFQSLNYGSCSYGNFCTVTDRYLGFEFQIAGNVHYGWARLDADAQGNVWAVKDYAYEDVAATNINAGDLPVAAVAADSASTVTGLDIAENSDGSDLSVAFAAGTDETTISEYRVIAVKETAAAGFDLASADAIIPAQYTVVTPLGNTTYGVNLGAGAMDTDGDLITIGVAYRLFVLSVADGTNATVNSLSGQSNSTTLNTTALTASSIVASDIADDVDASDIEVSFAAATDESGIAEYRVMIVKSGSAGAFDLATAESVALSSYEAISAGGAATYSGNFTTGKLDGDGDAIVLAQDYNIFVLSVADGVDANLNDLSVMSPIVSLNTAAGAANSIVATDVDDNANGTDLNVAFDSANNETNISSYRLIAVKDVASGAFTMVDAQSLSNASYTEVTPTGGSYTELLNATQEDSDGDDIVLGQAYHIFILSVADGVGANMDSLNSTSATVTLNTTTAPASSVVGSDIADNGNASDAQIDFDAAANEAGIDEYRILIVKASSAGGFDLSSASAVVAGNYTVVSPDGSTDYTKIISVSGKDVDGDAIVEFEDYQAFVMSKSDGTNANLDTLSGASATFELSSDTTGTAINDVVFENSSAYFNASNDIIIELSNNLVGDKIQASLFNLLGKNLKTVTLDYKTNLISNSNLSKGLYLLVLESQDGASRTFKLMK